MKSKTLISIILTSASLAAASANESPIRTTLQPLVDAHEIPGAVAIAAESNKILGIEAVGYADIENKIPMTENTIFWAASQTKPLTAAAFMTLVEEGKIGLDDPISKYIPEFAEMAVRNADGTFRQAKNPITPRRLLTHTSGLPFAVQAESPTFDTLTLEERAKEYAQTILDTEPGTNANYSNAGLNLIGRLIEIVSGKPYEVYLQEKILTPLGMTDTTFVPTAKQEKRIAKSYKENGQKNGFERVNIDQLRYPLTDKNRKPLPSGGLFSTAGDLLKFMQMIANRGEYDGVRILKPETVEEMIIKQTPDSVPQSFGLGFYADTNVFGHHGAYATAMFAQQTKDLITIYMVQKVGSWPGNGNQGEELFKKAALELYEADIQKMSK